jgi:hypothetical protein
MGVAKELVLVSGVVLGDWVEIAEASAILAGAVRMTVSRSAVAAAVAARKCVRPGGRGGAGMALAIST